MIFIMHQCTPNLIYSSEFCRFSRKHVIRSLRDKHSCERSGQRDWLSFGGGTRREISKNNFPSSVINCLEQLTKWRSFDQRTDFQC
ncbi:hypothetical protein CEXT_660371 [Caerostris extrusa]|uniref:Ycf15 n=1 Tax=Caerostris extrusa TaxID=172846 RepID=A0AAV4UGS2_CAEEX|nr:hypothetical protein CEXT_660371 [Caerostris extrusa]